MDAKAVREPDLRIEDLVDWLLEEGDAEGPSVRVMRGALVAAYERGKRECEYETEKK